jgi:hypothetical protein
MYQVFTVNHTTLARNVLANTATIDDGILWVSTNLAKGLPVYGERDGDAYDCLVVAINDVVSIERGAQS